MVLGFCGHPTHNNVNICLLFWYLKVQIVGGRHELGYQQLPKVSGLLCIRSLPDILLIVCFCFFFGLCLLVFSFALYF
jgi:hypothetical protein